MMQKIEDKMFEYISSLNDEHVNGFFKALPGGKKLRSKLILNIANPTNEAISLCAIVELIHLASLLHDDVIDNSLKRRGKKSFNALYGDKNAIMLGDVLYSFAFYKLCDFSKDVAKIISQAVAKLSVGEMLDVRLSDTFNENRDLYLDMIYKKTASLIEASSISAALLVGKDVKSFGEYGKNLGLAFQIIDDILDITQDSQTLGKPNLSDFKEGKTTLPYMYLYETLNDSDKVTLKSFFKKELSKDEEQWIKDKMQKTGALEKSVKEAKSFGQKALIAIKYENVPKLHEVVNAMIDREF